MLLASTSDLDDAIPTLVAYQLEWNKLHALLRAAELPDEPEPLDVAEACGGSEEDWTRVRESWPDGLAGLHRRGPRPQAEPAPPDARRLAVRLRAADAALVGAGARDADRPGPVGPADVLRLLQHALAREPRHDVGGRERGRDRRLRRVAAGPDYLIDELERFRSGRTEGSWENFLYYGARLYYESQPDDGPGLGAAAPHTERELGVTHLSSRTGLRVSAQVMELAKLDPAGLDSRLGPIDGERLASTPGVVVNIEYPLGLAAYNILREITTAHDTLRGVYVLGKAATLNADVGDVLISGVIHDEHSGSTYWLDNAFSFDDIAPYLVFGCGLDNQRAVTVKSTFLQNRNYLDFYYREAYTVVEMEAGPFCNAVYEIADADRYPSGEAVNFAKLPIDLGIIHYASDTPYSQARTLGARGLSYYGLDSTYASSVAIMRRILTLEGLYDD